MAISPIGTGPVAARSEEERLYAGSTNPTNGVNVPNLPDDIIRRRSHELWEAAGRPEGRDQEFWYQAERELKHELIKHELKTPDTL